MQVLSGPQIKDTNTAKKLGGSLEPIRTQKAHILKKTRAAHQE